MKFTNTEKKPSQCDVSCLIGGFKSGALKDGDAVALKGTIHRIKEMSGFAFVIIRSVRFLLQCVWEEGKSQCAIRDFNPEECVRIEGRIKNDARSPVGFEIHIDSMTRISGRAHTLPVEIGNDHKIENLNLDTLLDNRVLTLRNPKVRAIMRISDGVMHAFRSFLREEGFAEFVPPKIVSCGAEGGADMFQVDYFGRKAFLNQSPQMYKQIMVGVFQKAYTVGPVFRAEKHSTNRHINEFQGLDLEMGFIDSYEDLLNLEARMFTYMYQLLNEQYAEELELFLGKGRLLEVPTVFPQIKFTEAKQLFLDAHTDTHKAHILMETDFAPEEEKWLGDYFLREFGASMVFVTHYPSVKRPFYAMDDPKDTRYTLSFDMLLNGLEVTTGGQRIHDYEQQVKKMQDRKMNIEDFEDYLTMHKYGMPPHGGMGLGLERIVQNLLGIHNIKQATAFPRDRDRLRP